MALSRRNPPALAQGDPHKFRCCLCSFTTGETSESSLVGLTAGRSVHPRLRRDLELDESDVLFSTSLAGREFIWLTNLPSIVRTIVLGLRWHCAFSRQTSSVMSLRLNQVLPEVVTQYKEGAGSTWTAKPSCLCRITAGIWCSDRRHTEVATLLRSYASMYR